MKRIYLLATFSLLTIVGAKAQTGPTTGVTTVQVQLDDIMSITVNNPEVLLRFANAADYEDGIVNPQNGHLTVTSNKPYTINVKALGLLSGVLSGNTNTLEADVVSISLPASGNNTNLGGTLTTVGALATTDAALITGATPVTSQPIDVLYAIPASVSSSNRILGKNADTYSTVVTYTITQ